MKETTKEILITLLLILIILAVLYGTNRLGDFTFHQLNPGVNATNFDPWRAYNA